MHPFATHFQRWRYLYLLGALLTLLVVHPIVASFRDLGPVFDALFVLVMLVMALGLANEKRWRIFACLLCIPAAALSIGGHFITSPAEGVSVAAGHAMGALFFVAVACKIVQSVLTSQQLSLDSIFGAICGYLLLGVACALTYATIYAAAPDSFHVSEAVRQQLAQADEIRNLFIYYSFITLTSVGYGDVTPLSMPARTLAWVEAVTGQLYLAILIAGLISALVGSDSARNRRKRDH